jgi:hypothetical protein
MIVVGYSDTWNEWTVSEVLDEMLDFGAYSYGGRPATRDDVEVVTTHYYGEDWMEYGGTDYRYLIHDGMTLPEAFGIGYRAINEFIEEQNSEWEDTKYAEGNEW